MITIVIFVLAVFIIYGINIAVFYNSMNLGALTLIFLAALVGIILINALIAIICCKLFPDKWFLNDSRFFMSSKKECRFYEKLGIKNWKDRVLELGKLNNFRKNKINDPNNPKYVEKFIIENNKGFLDHFISIIVCFLAIFIMPMKFWLPMALPLAIASFLLNVMPLFVLRYNMPRLKTLLKYAQRNELRKEKTDI